MPQIRESNSPLASELMILQFLAGIFLSTWIVHRAMKLWLLPAKTDSKLSDPPFLTTAIPFIGHILGLTSKGSNTYISSLWSANRRRLFSRSYEADYSLD
jgi:hypothetical protein